jgi:3-deoxy-D-manno-octulosonate 8-phosphate phosphatase (KDO 8-P phosphatase)
MSTAWGLAYDVPEPVLARARAIRLAVFDVDGVMTDGSLYVGPSGEDFKCFNVYDGHGVHLLSAGDIATAVITARSSRALEHRARELGITHCLMARRNKLEALGELLHTTGFSTEQCSYVGDDVVDVPALLHCGLAVAVPNAHRVARQIAHWVTPSVGGNGAVREVCEMILHAQGKLDPILKSYLVLDKGHGAS